MTSRRVGALAEPPREPPERTLATRAPVQFYLLLVSRHKSEYMFRSTSCIALY